MNDADRTVEPAPRRGVIHVLCVLALLILVRALGERAWWIAPCALFAGSIIMALVDRRGPLTVRCVLVFAAIAVAFGAVLKLTA